MCYSLTWRDRKTIDKFKKEAKKQCVYCGKSLTNKEDITVDHITPISRGGKTVKENLGMCCEQCNSEKSDMTYEEYIEYLEIKKDLLNNNKVWSEFNSAILSLQKIIDIYNSAINNIAQYQKEKHEIENIIRDVKANASEGYLLFKDLQNILKNIKENEKIKRTTQSASMLAKENVQQLECEKIKLENKIMISIRNECSIGRISSLNIDRLDFSKWEQKSLIQEVI